MMQQLLQLLTKLESSIPDHDKSNTRVSASNVGWHIEHLLLVIIKVTGALKQADPKAYTSHFNLAKTLVFTLNKIPRGKVKAPASVVPPTEITTATLQSTLQQARENLQALTSLSSNHFFKHPYFGNLNVRQSVKFLRIHTIHHIKIIEQIIKQETH